MKKSTGEVDPSLNGNRGINDLDSTGELFKDLFRRGLKCQNQYDGELVVRCRSDITGDLVMLYPFHDEVNGSRPFVLHKAKPNQTGGVVDSYTIFVFSKRDRLIGARSIDEQVADAKRFAGLDPSQIQLPALYDLYSLVENEIARIVSDEYAQDTDEIIDIRQLLMSLHLVEPHRVEGTLLL